MAFPKDNRTILIIGGGVAVVVAVVAALMFTSGSQAPSEKSPASSGGLTVNLADAPGLDTARELRCFVNGQFVGTATLAVCAQRNGVATDALDVGLDNTGALAAAQTAAFAPPPTQPQIELAQGDGGAIDVTPPDVGATPSRPVQTARPPMVQPASSGSPCLRHNGSEWRVLSNDMSLDQCVQALYSGTCVGPGEALYGRSGEVTLRLVPRRVEQSNDNTRFRVLVQQDRDCQFRVAG